MHVLRGLWSVWLKEYISVIEGTAPAIHRLTKIWLTQPLPACSVRRTGSNVYFYHWYIFFGMALWTPYVHIITPVAHILVLHNAGNPGFVRSQLFCNIWIWLLCCADIYTEHVHHKNNENKEIGTWRLACFNKLWMFVKTKFLIFFVTECFVCIIWNFLKISFKFGTLFGFNSDFAQCKCYTYTNTYAYVPANAANYSKLQIGLTIKVPKNTEQNEL